MPIVEHTTDVSCSLSRVYQYLRFRYDGAPYRVACREVMGYIPPVVCEDAIEDRSVEFSVSGYDPLFRLRIGGWKWRYRLERLDESNTRLTISYHWHWFFALLGFGMIRQQARNALARDVLTMQALAFNE